MNKYTPRMERVLELALEESESLNHSYVGTEHCLLALLRNGQGVAINVLHKMGVQPEKARELILAELDPAEPPSNRTLQARINALEAKIARLEESKQPE